MGKATRWFKGLLGMNKQRDPQGSSVSSGGGDTKPERRRWSIGKSAAKDPSEPAAAVRISESAWPRSYAYDETEVEQQTKHAIAVAAATAAAADAAVAAAQAAAAVVRLTSQCKGAALGGGRERRAAVKIQTVFRGFLARKALRALKGLVKLQALVRGYLVRKRAAATLHSMQAMIRAQAAVRSRRIGHQYNINKENRYLPENRVWRSTDELHSKRYSVPFENPMNGFEESPKIVEIDTIKPRSRSRRMNNALVECSEDFCYHEMSSPLPYPHTARLSVPDSGQLEEYEWYYPVDESRFSTAQSTPRFANSFHSNAPATPAKSVCGDSFFRPYSNFPNYMSGTQSSKNKLRSHSAPRQRPGHEAFCSKKKLSLNEIMAARNSISGVRMQTSCDHLNDLVLNY